MTDQPVLITRNMVLDALKDAAFFKSMPEFLTLKPKLDTMGAQIGGCSGCRGRTIAQNIMADFLVTLSVMDAAAVARLKAYFKVDKLMYNAHDPRTGAYVTKIL